MKTKKYSLISLFALVMVTCFALAMTACVGKTPTDTTQPDKGEAGVYYTETKDGEWTVSLAEGKFTLTASGETKFGSYKYDDKTITLTDTKSNAVISGTLENQKLILDYNGGKYLFNKKIDYVVTFKTNEDSFTQTVTNGKCAEKPADPQKDGYQFVGWYADEAFTAGYDFASPVTANTNVYGRMEKKEIGQNEYNVTFMVDGREDKTEKTVNGVCYGLYTPTAEGKEFLGWWTSDLNAAEKLTAKYNGEKLTADTTLYAVWKDSSKVAVSATAGKIEWTAAAPNITYNLKVTGPNGYQTSMRPQATTVDFDFSELEAGTYEITVEYSTFTGKAYYKNKALAKVSGLKVIEPSVLVFDSVENADYYTISVVCGNPDHNHENFNNGKSTNFNFANCPMKEDGIKFTVTAHAYGYVDSLPATYTCLRSLGKIGGIKVDDSGDYVVWDTVDGATSYVATISVNGTTYVKDLGGENSLSIADLTGNVEISVVAKADGYNSSNTVKVTYTRNKLPSPTGIRIAEKRLYWNKVDGATGYVVYFNGTEYEVKNGLTNYLLTDAIAATDKTVYIVKVKAVAENEANNSAYSETMTMQLNGITGLKYSDGTLSWNPVANAYKYSLKINGKETTIDASVANSTALTFTQSGVNEIELAVIDSKNNTSSYAKLNVTVYGVYFDARGGKECKTVYLAIGDKIVLPDSENEGYAFGGWYNLPGGPESNAKEYNNGQTLVTTGDVVLYAYWTSRRYDVTLDVDGGAELAETVVKVGYNGKYVLPVPSEVGSQRVGMKFNGWYSNPNGAGVQYTDNNGNSLGVYRDSKDVTLYAYWVDIFSYTLERDLEVQGQEAYVISKAPGFALVSSDEVVTVPAYYKGVRVQTVSAGAFKNCTNLTRLRIPNTISIIETGLNGDLSSAFEGCSNLVDVTIYEVEDFTGTPRYYSEKGILISNANDSKQSTIEFVPKGLTGSLVIPEGVQVIPEGIFASSKITDVVIPYTVKTIAKDAFKSNYSLVNVVFEERPANYLELKKAENKDYDPTKDLGLTIVRDAFSNCNYIESVELPAHLYSIDITSISSTKLASIVLGCKDGTKSTGGYYTLENSICVDSEGTNEKKLFYFAKGISGEYAIPEEITTIGSLAFSGSKLSSVIIGENVTLIEAYAFSGTSDGKPIDASGEYAKAENAYGEPPFKGSACTKLEKITFNGKIDSEYLVIKEGAFYDAASSSTPLSSLTLPANLAELGAYAFGNISGLYSVKVDIAIDVQDSDKKYSNNAFANKNGDKAITSVTLGTKVPSSFNVSNVFGSSKLASVTVDQDNANFYSDDYGVLYDRVNKEDGSYDYSTTIKYYPKGKEGEFTLPDTVTKIEGGVFAGATKLTKITIHEDVSFIGANAFDGCSSLAEVIFSPSTKKDENGKIIEVELEIGDEAFATCKALKEIVIPGRAQKLGESVFSTCSGLVTATFEEGVQQIGDGVFNKCTSLVAVIFPASLEKFGTYDANGNLTGVSKAFSGCTALETIDVDENNKTMMTDDGVLYLIFETTTDAGEGKDPVKDVAYELVTAPLNKTGSVNIPAKTRKIWDYAFQDNTGITEITFGTDNKMAGTLEIGKFAFSRMTKLTSITLPVGLETIKNSTFYGNVKDEENVLQTITIPYTVTKIETHAFVSCTALENVIFQDLPSTDATERADLIKKYPLELSSGGMISTSYDSGWGMFYKCNLNEVSLPERTTKIGAYSFADSRLKKIFIPKTVSTIETGAFLKCDSLTDVVFEDGSAITQLPAYCFYGTALGGSDSSKGTIKLPENLTTMGYQTFAECTQLESIYFGAKFENFSFPFTAYTAKGSNGDFAVTTKQINSSIYTGKVFDGCYALTEILFDDDIKLKEIPKDTFKNTGVVNLELPATLTNLGESAFWNSINLEAVTFKTYTLESVLKATGKTAESELTDVEKAKIGKSDLAVVAKQAFGVNSNSKYGVKNVTFPETTANALSLGERLFAYDTRLEVVVIPSKVSVLQNVFKDCTASVDIQLSKDNKSLKINSEYNLVLSQSGDTIEFAYGTIAKDEVDLTKLGSDLAIIKDSAFASQTTIKKVIIPSTVKTIGSKAFDSCTNLETVEFKLNDKKESNLESVGTYAFNKCSSLSSIDFTGTNVTAVSEYLFYSCASLKEVTMTDKITSIGKNAFYECKLLKSVTIPSSVETIGDSAFDRCASLQVVEFEKESKFTAFGKQTFNYCRSLVSIVLPEKLASLGTSTFYRCSALTSIEIPSLVTAIGDSVFNECTSLTDITFKGNVTAIGSSSFAKTALASFDFSSIESIGASAFMNCTQLVGTVTKGNDGKETVNAIDLSGVKSLGETIFSGCTLLQKVKLTKDDGTGLAVLPNGLFENCSSLTQITLPSNVTFLGKNTFASSGLTSIYLPKGITTILSASTKSASAYDSTSTKTFYNCVDLKAITTEVKGQITNVAGNVFEGCVSLVDFDFTNIVYLGGSAFKGAKIGYKENEKGEALLADYKLDLSKLKTVGSSVFEGCNYIADVTFGQMLSAANATKAFYGCLGLKKVTFVKTTAAQALPNAMFEGCVNLTDVTLQSNFNKIGNTAFRYTAITSIEIPEKVTSIGASAFANNDKLKTVTFADSTSTLTIDGYVFQECVALQNIALPERLTKIGDYAFQNCKSLNVTDDGVFELPSKLASSTSSSLGIGKGAFAGCETIKEFAIDSSNEYFTTVNGLLYSTRYGTTTKKDYYMLVAVPCAYEKAITITADDGIIAYAFKYVKGINEITFAEGMTEIPNTILAGFTGLSTVNLPSTIVKIGNGSFNGCVSLRNINLPEGLETIDGYAFQDCAGLKILDFPSTLTTIGSSAFNGAGLTQVVLPDNLSSLGTTVFFNCAELETVILNDSLENLPESAFQDCVKLASIDLKNVASIGKSAFNGCLALINVDAKKLDSIGASAFTGCASLDGIDLTGVTSIGANAFESAFTALAVADRPVVTIPSSIETLGSYLFKGAAVKEVKFDGVPEKDGVLTLPDYMFQNSTIEKVVLPKGLVTLPKGMFAGCKNVDITYPDTLTTIEAEAFSGYECESMTIPSTVTTLKNSVFATAKIDTVVIPGTVTTMGMNLFKDSAIRKIMLGNGIETINDAAFQNCAELEEVDIPNSVKFINDKAFIDCVKLKKLILPAGVVLQADTAVFNYPIFDGWTEEQTVYFRGSENDMVNWVGNWRGTGKMNVVFNYKGE